MQAKKIVFIVLGCVFGSQHRRVAPTTPRGGSFSASLSEASTGGFLHVHDLIF